MLLYSSTTFSQCMEYWETLSEHVPQCLAYILSYKWAKALGGQDPSKTWRHLMSYVSLCLMVMLSKWTLREPPSPQSTQENTKKIFSMTVVDTSPVWRCHLRNEHWVVWFCEKRKLNSSWYTGSNLQTWMLASSLHVRKMCPQEWLLLQGTKLGSSSASTAKIKEVIPVRIPSPNYSAWTSSYRTLYC